MSVDLTAIEGLDDEFEVGWIEEPEGSWRIFRAYDRDFVNYHRRRRSYLKRTITKALKLSQEEAAKALHVLVSEGKLAARDVYGALRRREKLIREIRTRLHALGVEGVELAGDIRKVAVARFRRAEEASREPRRKAVSAARRAAMQAQGRYLAAIRQLSKQARAKIKAIRKKSGVKAAIAAARRMAK